MIKIIEIIGWEFIFIEIKIKIEKIIKYKNKDKRDRGLDFVIKIIKLIKI